ncbi:Feruloyl esterase [Bertholletia excelsa]
MSGAVRTQESQHPVTQWQKVIIQNDHGENLVGILHETGSTNLVIVCHGFRSSKDRIPMVNLAVALEKEGMSAFRFDFAGNGESEGIFRYGNYRREANDLHAVVQYFRTKGHSITAVVGHSKGGNAALLYASIYKDVHRVVNIAGRFNLKRGIEGRLGKDFLERIKQNRFIDVKNRRGKVEYRVTEESLMDRLATDMQAACLSIPLFCRVLTIHGTMDEYVPVEDAKEFDQCVPNHKLHIIDGADHEYTRHPDELASVVLDFITADLHPDKDMPTRFASGTRESKFIRSRF